MRPDSPIACAAFLHRLTMTCCNCAGSPNTARPPGAPRRPNQRSDDSDARRSRGRLAQQFGDRDERRTGIRPASEGKDAVDQVSPPFRGLLDLSDPPRRLAARFHLRAGHFGVAKDRGDDVVEVVGDAAGELAHQLQAQRALEPRGQFGLFALADLALESVGDRVSGEPHRLQREKISPRAG